MSAIYNLEPPTKGKVVLKTSLGDIDIELWAKEAPKAVRNFVQLCLEGYYDGCVFHRVLKDFLAQTGDPTGTGSGGESVYGAPFKDEFHSRLRFSHRGIVACANANVEHSNGSQFFITLGPTESLQKKNTIFGKVGGETIYNAMEINNLDVDESTERPEDPPIIKEVEVLWNPFDDIVPRSTRAEREAAARRAAEEAAAAAKRTLKKQKKNATLLSFEEEEDGGDGGGGSSVGRLKSAHELVDDARLVKADTEEEKRLAAEEAEAAAVRKAAVQARLAKLSARKGDAAAGRADAADGGASPAAEDDSEVGFDARMRAQALARRDAHGDAAPAARDGASSARPPPDSDEDSDDDSDGGGKQRDSDKRRAAALAGRSKAAVILPSRQVRIEDAELLKPWELKRREYKQRARLTGRREKDTLAKMREFEAAMAAKSKVDSPAARDAGGDAAQPPEMKSDEVYRGQVLKDIDHEALKPAAWRIDALQDEEEDEDDFQGGLEALRAHTLAFPKKAKQGAMDRDMDDDDNLVVVDPLLEKGKEKWNRQQAKAQKRATEWGSGHGGGGDGRERQRQRF